MSIGKLGFDHETCGDTPLPPQDLVAANAIVRIRTGSPAGLPARLAQVA
ncbi:hypothetical protein [Cupriavidus lacunae]|nr:hypothetical protein [Cupriavidus lacunae]